MFRLLLGLLWRFFHSRRDLLLEHLARRQQLLAVQRRRPRPRLARLDRLLWVVARRLWPQWKQALVIALPRPLYAGIAPDSACTGIGSRAIERPSAENELVNRCEI